MAKTFLTLVALSSLAYATPTPANHFVKRDLNAIFGLTDSQVSYFEPFTYYASAAYCPPNETVNWDCGANCQANSGFQPVVAGGDGDGTQYWYVGYDPSFDTIVVAHQGTDPSNLLADLTDLDFLKQQLDSTLFPGLSEDIEVHGGFADEHAKTAKLVLSGVQKSLSSHPGASVTMVGHSLGAALALLDSVYLPLHLDTTKVPFRTVLYGLPRVGNQAFANYVDATNEELFHITNKKDPVPTVPGKFFGFVHPSGELHIEDNNVWASCPGQDNDSQLCSVGEVPLVFDGEVSDHDGPYGSVKIGC